MSLLRVLGIEVLQTLLRMLPFPCRTGLVRIGRPDRSSPVLMTCNFRLSVERVKRALRGVDAYLLVANSRGVNVWCAATGGLFTNHDAISVIETSGIEKLVDHRRVILPQLAATGIEGPEIRRQTGWRVLWGPVEARDIPAFLRAGCETSPKMRRVSFPLPRRLEMAVAWAFPISFATLLMLPFWPQSVLPVAALVWGLSLSIFGAFPLYARGLDGSSSHLGFVVFDFGPRGAPLVIWGIFSGGVAGWLAFTGDLSWGAWLQWSGSSLGILAILSLDLMGSTPVYKSGLHSDRLLRIDLDEALCKGAGFCARVCPTDVFEMKPGGKLVTLPRKSQCVQCGACIVQCPFDALRFSGLDGESLPPDVIRRFKLNLMGRRTVAASKGDTLAQKS